MRGFIFDMDGTLLDTNGLWWELPGILLEKEGIPCPEELRERLGVEECGQLTKRMLELGILPYTYETVWPRYHQLIEQEYRLRALPRPGALPLLDRLVGLGMRRCVATATPTGPATVALERSGLMPRLDFVQSVHTLGISKSKPEFFKKIAAQMGLPAESCVVVEDALYAVRGAKGAGATVWAIADRWMASDWPQIQREADRSFESLEEMAQALV